MADEAKESTRRDPSKEELEVAFSGPAPSANRFYVTVGPQGVRLSFIEQVPNSSQNFFRSAAVLSHQDAIQLSEILKELLVEPVEKVISKAESDASK